MLRIIFIIGLVLIAVTVALLLFQRMSPRRIAIVLRIVGAVVLLAVGTFLSIRGAGLLGGPLVVFGITMLARAIGMNLPGGRRKTPGQQSRVRTSIFAMELDHDTGNFDGDVLSGAFKGRRLSEFSLEELVLLMDECILASDQSQALLEAYLDRMHPHWREGAPRDEKATPPTSGEMTRDEAYDILGLAAGASKREITAAHRRLMKKFHPDYGGSNYLAARINQAKDILLGGA